MRQKWNPQINRKIGIFQTQENYYTQKLYIEKQKQSTVTELEKVQTLELLGKEFKSTIINIFKELKEIPYK